MSCVVLFIVFAFEDAELSLWFYATSFSGISSFYYGCDLKEGTF
jgi:hypothetical protein